MLESIRFPDAEGRADQFPFDIPALQGLEVRDVATPVTLLGGENGPGKSTVLAALAAATGLRT
ncbi:MAG: AAA family ATPase, partial [Gammaproteobacteria bacterium]|nr:AAA family ATPase [Gammaproteobacteria bacterium]